MTDERLTLNELALIPLSETVFGGAAGRIEFLVDGSGNVSGLHLRAAEGDLRAARLAP